MLTRSSSSNLCKTANIQSQDSESISNSTHIDNVHTQVKNYTLNVGRSLKKKLSGCASDHLAYEMKPGKNLVVSLSSAAYELTKRYIVEKAQSIEFSNMFAFVKERGVDQNNAVVEFRLKFLTGKKTVKLAVFKKL